MQGERRRLTANTRRWPILVLMAALSMTLLAWFDTRSRDSALMDRLSLWTQQGVRNAIAERVGDYEALLLTTRHLVGEAQARLSDETWALTLSSLDAVDHAPTYRELHRQMVGFFAVLSTEGGGEGGENGERVWLAQGQAWGIGSRQETLARAPWRPLLAQAAARRGLVVSEHPVLFGGVPAMLMVLPLSASRPGDSPARDERAGDIWVGVAFRLEELVAEAQRGLPLPVGVELFSERGANAHLLARSGLSEPEEGSTSDADPSLSMDEVQIAVGDRSWLLRTTIHSNFMIATGIRGQMVVLSLGFALAFVLWIAILAMRRNEVRFRDLAEAASDWFWETDSEFRLVYVSERFFTTTGLETSAILGRTLWDLAGPRQIHNRRQAWEACFRLLTRREPLRDMEITFTDGQNRPLQVELSGKPVFFENGTFSGYRGVGTDVTARRQAEATAATRAAQLQATIAAMPNGMIMFDEDLKLVLYNRKFLELWGLTEQELLSCGDLRAFVRHLAERGRYGTGDVEEMVANRLHRITRPTAQVYELSTGDGRIMEVCSYGKSAVGYLLTYLDITQRRRSEDALRQTEERLTLALTATGAGTWDMDLVGHCCWWSPQLANLMGYQPWEISPTPWAVREYVHAEDWPETHRRAQRHLQGVTPEFRAQYRLRSKDRGWVWVEDVGKAVRNAAGQPVRFIGTIVDISNRRAAEEELMQAERMAALGRLVAGVAHEINTPVGLGLSVASFLEQKIKELGRAYAEGTLAQEDFDAFLATGSESCASLLFNLRRAADLVRSFKQVAVDRSCQQQRPFNLRSYLNEVVLSLRPKLKSTMHRLNISCEESITIVSDPGAWSQILTNLVENSLIHGFDGIEAGVMRLEIEEAAGILEVIYTDSGRGMTAEQVEKIFDPFFTTRLGRGGSGLGMHIVYTIVTRTLGGVVSCASAPGQGIRIAIRMPLQPRSAPAGEASPGETS